jgi:hypothetical protein
MPICMRSSGLYEMHVVAVAAAAAAAAADIAEPIVGMLRLFETLQYRTCVILQAARQPARRVHMRSDYSLLHHLSTIMCHVPVILTFHVLLWHMIACCRALFQAVHGARV